MNPIDTWIETGADYATGKQLYNAYAPRYRASKVKAEQINNFDNSYSRELLRTELMALRELLCAKEVSSPGEQKAQSNRYIHNKDIKLPPDLETMRDEIPKLYKQRDRARYSARDEMQGPKLLQLAMEAVRLDQRIRRAYRILDYYTKTGMFPPDYIPAGDKADERLVDKLIFWLKAQKSYPSQISRLNKDPERADEVAEMRQVMSDINQFLEHHAHKKD